MTPLRVTIRVKPGSGRTAVGSSYAEPPQLVVAVTAPAIDGRANDAVVDALAAALGVRPSRISIALGLTSRTKQVSIDVDADAVDRVSARISELLSRPAAHAR